MSPPLVFAIKKKLRSIFYSDNWRQKGSCNCWTSLFSLVYLVSLAPFRSTLFVLIFLILFYGIYDQTWIFKYFACVM